MMPDVATYTTWARAFGIRKSRPVVVYDNSQGWFANRGAFMIRAFGHPNVRVLDGGLTKWKACGYEVV